MTRKPTQRQHPHFKPHRLTTLSHLSRIKIKEFVIDASGLRLSLPGIVTFVSCS